ncbi:MAG: ABC transporter ATP-binding protein [Candidatus Limiplasma sp.]|nr:ABC transporter ATP-binding protein [Candidatus Limiplasma sp.]
MIEFKRVTKKYGKETVVSDISFTIDKGSLVVLIGPSGCGKTTLLKMINRLIAPTSGDILINNESIFDQDEIQLRRNIGYVIQQTGLFPHMTVRENIEIIPRLQKKQKENIVRKSIELMSMIGLDPDVYLDRYPFQLSGGQQQRIGVARAFACDPEVILMDEPFSALDPITRLQLQDELADLQGKLHKTIVFVTHDMDEAVKIADKICLIHEGAIAQYDTVEDMMKSPATDYVAEFIGKNRIWSSPEFIRAQDIMINDPVCASPDVTIMRCIERMRKLKVDSLMITDKENRLLGIVLAKNLQPIQDKSQPVGQVMEKEYQTVAPDVSILSILEIINGGSMSSIPVVDEAMGLKGLITKTSLLTTLSQQYSEGTEVAQ